MGIPAPREAFEEFLEAVEEGPVFPPKALLPDPEELLDMIPDALLEGVRVRARAVAATPAEK